MCRMGHGISLRGVARPSRRRSRARGVSRGTRRRTHRDAALAYSDRHGMPGLLRPQSLCEHFDPRRSRHVARRSDGAGETNQHEGANRRYRLKKSASRDADLTKPRSRPAIPRIAWPARLERLRRTGTNNGMHPGRRKYPSRPPGAGPRPTYQTPSSHLTVKQRSHHHHP